MLIGVLSDTHIPKRARHLPPALFKIFDGVDMILHAGDLTEENVLAELSAIAPVEAVAGNMDSPELAEKLGRRKLLSLSGYSIGLIHGDLGPDRIKTPLRSYEAFSGEKADIIIFGHTHRPHLEKVGEILLFNPGSPTDRRREPRHSCGLITLEDEAKAKIVYL